MSTETGYRHNGKERLLERTREEARFFWSDIELIRRDAQELAAKEVELLQAEVQEEASKLVRAALWGAVAGVAGLLLTAFLGLALMFALAEAMDLWLAALITSGVITGLALLAGALAYLRLKSFSTVPRRTMRTLREDAKWAGNLMRSSAR